uniref:Uncharacterized protein n=1 Tax=Eutreptiella gymnastica TaxID=73025 RepID=A0A7S4CUN9_9EUGL
MIHGSTLSSLLGTRDLTDASLHGVVVLAVILVTLIITWASENPYNARHHRRRTSLCGITGRTRWEMPQNPTLRDRFRWFLDAIGFFYGFGLVAAVTICLELFIYLEVVHPPDQLNYPWLFIVGYVSSNHFLYALHHLLGTCLHSKTLKDTAGVGGFFLHSHRKSMRVFLFSEHKLADLWVHFGMAWRHPWRLDHWLELWVHFMKYCDRPVKPLTRAVPLIHNAMPLDDCIDCLAHSVTGLLVLGPMRFAGCIVIAEAARIMLKLDIAMHHLPETDAKEE